MAELDTVMALARKDLACYAIALHPGFELAPHHKATIGKLEAVERGEIRRLILAEPPQHGKSLITSELFPAWYLGRHPDHSVITATYGQDLSSDFGRKVRNTVSDPLHQLIFPACQLASDSAGQQKFDTDQGGSYFAVGRGGAITGRGANLLVVDDPLKDAEEAHSQTIRRALHEWFRQVAFTRLRPDARILIIGTRWHEDDLIGMLLREHVAEGWQLVSMPAVAEQDDSFRKAGEALWPTRYPLDVLESIRRQIGGSAFVSLYQQRPSAAEGSVFKREWFRKYRELPGSFQKIVQSWDTAFKTGQQNDFSVSTTWGVTENGFYLLSMWRSRAEFPELKRQVAAQAEAWKPHKVLIEDRASGQSLIQELKHATRFPILPVKVDNDKRTRAEAVSPFFEAGKVLLPEGAPWLADLEDELASFPSGLHDDIVDSVTMALNHLRVVGFSENSWIIAGPKAWREAEKARTIMAKTPEELAAAQKRQVMASFNRPTVFGAEKSGINKPLRQQVAVKPNIAACPKCGNTILGRAGDFVYCNAHNCGWNTKQTPEPPKPPEPSAEPPAERRGIPNFIVGRSNL